MNKDHMLIGYLNGLIDRVYKILPLFEEENRFLEKYISSLLFEIDGLISHKKLTNTDLLKVVGTLESLGDCAIDAEYDIPLIRREVFKCTTIIEKIISNMSEESP